MQDQIFNRIDEINHEIENLRNERKELNSDENCYSVFFQAGDVFPYKVVDKRTGLFVSSYSNDDAAYREAVRRARLMIQNYKGGYSADEMLAYAGSSKENLVIESPAISGMWIITNVDEIPIYVACDGLADDLFDSREEAEEALDYYLNSSYSSLAAGENVRIYLYKSKADCELDRNGFVVISCDVYSFNTVSDVFREINKVLKYAS